MGGFGKTWMAQFISNRLKDQYGFINKWIDSKSIEDSFRNILINDFAYENEMLKNKNITNLLNNELRDFIQTKNDLKILFIFDNIKNDEEIKKYINNLPKKINVLITTRNKKLLSDLKNTQIIKLNSFNKENSIKYFRNSIKITEFYQEDQINSFVDKLIFH